MNNLACWETKFKYCCYSKRLLTKLLLLNKKAKQKVNILKIKKAIYFAKEYHGDQKRLSGELYYTHPIEVALMVADFRFTTNIIVASLLHDVVEDTCVTIETIDKEFGGTVAKTVEKLTRNNGYVKFSVEKTIYDSFCEREEDALVLKIFDRIHNLKTLNFKPLGKRKKIIIETAQNFIVLAIYLKMVEIEKFLLNFFIQEMNLTLDLFQIQYCQKTFDYSCQLFSLAIRNDTSQMYKQ